MLLKAESLGDKLGLWQVCVIGLGIVFIGLICLIIICSVMALFFKGKKAEEKKQPSAAANVSGSSKPDIKNRQEFVAAVSAAIAEYSGNDINRMRIVSIKKL